ncbi:uncharacterized protein GLRG_06096 [Colletotrichum graminicola M1.001]|uniref:Uncharacterized protein n=1 Tax=Colletotrichum graminicola (strain M1.001 / M2 / FGSC 10212) TaxID=645133 RepID=E3QJB4_COLGM|nr:uncharacterized protein GLRG_06096 [Colletotrichum graminicola M1.001]EFQ30952.1 hypothetical protein GLRG_06096 [Colletotrichum graminicola M1.001]
MASKHRKGTLLVPVTEIQGEGGVFPSRDLFSYANGCFGIYWRPLLGASGSVTHSHRADDREIQHCKIEMRPIWSQSGIANSSGLRHVFTDKGFILVSLDASHKSWWLFDRFGLN